MFWMRVIPAQGEPARLNHSDLSRFYVNRAASNFHFKGSSPSFSLETAYDSPVMLRNLAYQSEAETHSTVVLLTQTGRTIERFEDALTLLCRNAGSLIGYPEQGATRI
jgi:hypothetical protein